MKVFELLERANANYDNEKKHLEGTTKEWMDAIGATPEDVAKARADAMELPSYKAVIQFAPDKTTAGEKKNGSFSFSHPGTGGKYNVYANGQIRATSTPNMWSGRPGQTKLVSPKPRLKHGDVVKSLVMIYDGAFKELSKKAEKSGTKREQEKNDQSKWRQGKLV